MVSYQFLDETDLTDSSVVQIMKDWFARGKVLYPDVILHGDQSGAQSTYEVNKAYVVEAQPDMVMFDDYPFNGAVTGGSPTSWYSYLQKYRLVGLAGLDGNGNEPIPYALYLQTYNNGHTVSDSEMRLNQFAAWAFGYQFAEAFVYSKPPCPPHADFPSVLFDGYGDSSPTDEFYQIAETNRQSRNLGPALVRLLSTDVRMVMGQHIEQAQTWYEILLGQYHNETVTNDTPSDITTELPGTDTYLTGATATNLGSKNDGLKGDVVIGFFKLLHESFDGDQYTNEKYFMVTNGLSDGSGSASETRQTIHLTFNFGSSEINSLQRLSRTTGQVEIIPLTNNGDGTYYLDLTLDGGTGDLFKYNTGAPFVGVEEVAAPSLVVTPETQTVVKDAGTATFVVSNGGTGTMAWTAAVTSSSGWVSITSGSSGTDSGSIIVSFTKNKIPATRTATITITAENSAGSPRSVTVVQSAADLIPGDANKDGVVDVCDLGILAANYGSSNKDWAQGDFNSDGIVDVGDLGILAANYGTGSQSASTFEADYAKVFGSTGDDAAETSDVTTQDSEDAGSPVCSSLGLSLIAGLAILGLMIVKLEE
jgi:hypothetical protein